MFFGNRERSRARRRGVVLILVLGMLALMALIGVTFATFAGQSLVSNRNFAQSVSFPTSEQVMDYALAQLINDTNNPTSALRGHSLLRDMYGNDSLMTGNAGSFRGYLSSLPDGSSLLLGPPVLVTQASVSSADTVNFAGNVKYPTNIPVYSLNPSLYGLDFTRWIVRIPSGYGNVAATYEVLADDTSGATHSLILSPADPATPTDSSGSTTLPVTRIYNNSLNISNGQSLIVPGIVGDPNAIAPALNKGVSFMNSWGLWSALNGNSTTVPFTLDCRYMRAFNGTGITHSNFASDTTSTPNISGVPHNSAAYGNFRFNGNLLAFPFLPPALQSIAQAFGDPNTYSLDEDYDACDLENWFLALQSADGQVMIPSFHRPGILTIDDWTSNSVLSYAKILRPRQKDNSPLFPPDPIPDATTGAIKYDVDNDGDGITDSVWLDLGFPAQRDGRGLTFKPLFAFMVIGLNGRLPLNTAGNLQSRDFQTRTNTTTPAPFSVEWGPSTLLDGSTWSHASHLGFSVNEINPLFALQNASNNVYGNSNPASPTYTQQDNSRTSVDVIQLRNLLAGTVPQNSLTQPALGLNNDTNFVAVAGQPWYVPNSMFDAQDTAVTLGNVPTVVRSLDPVMGRWGERNGIPKYLTVQSSSYATVPNGTNTVTSLVYTNPVRAGRSGLFGPTGWTVGDGTDDDYDAYDFYPFGNPNPSSLGLSPGEGFYIPATATTPPYGDGDYYDYSGSVQLPVERIRRYVTPIDPSGVGRVVAWNQRPLNVYDYGNGADTFGRAGFFRYFRPAGVPKVVGYDTATPAVNLLPTAAQVIEDAQRYNQPILVGPATSATPAGEWTSDKTNNLFHGYMSFLAPNNGIGLTNSGSPAAGRAVMASMPFDFTGGNPANYYTTAAIPIPFPRIVATGTGDASNPDNSSTMTTSVNTGQGPLLPFNDPFYNPLARVVAGYPNYPIADASGNPLPSASLNRDEADEMNLYTPNLYDAPFGPSDLEWLYRLQDVDGASLDSRLKHLAPISFLNPGDGATRRRLFTTDSWDLINFAFAPDNPLPLTAQDQTFSYNSRFNDIGTQVNYSTANGVPQFSSVSASLWAMNLNVNPTNHQYPLYQNATTLTQIANPTAFPDGVSTAAGAAPSLGIPGSPDPTVTGGLNPLPHTMTAGTNSQLFPVITPSLAHRDRKINLNYPLPVSNDPAEPVRQKWIRETYQFFKAILPPQAIDRPEELAQLSQFVVNIIDFRDPDCTTTRFVNTDLMVIPATTTSPPRVEFSNIPFPTGIKYHFPYDPAVYDEQNPLPYGTARDTNWTSVTTLAVGDYLVQHGMEYSPIAINEVVDYQYQANIGGASTAFSRFAIELVNTLSDDAAGNNEDLGELELDGWQLALYPDFPSGTAYPVPTTGFSPNPATILGRPDPTTGDIPANVFSTIYNDAISAAPTNTYVATIRAASSPTLAVTNVTFPLGANKLSAIKPAGPKYFVLGTPYTPYNATTHQGVNEEASTGNSGVSNIANDAALPASFNPPAPSTAGKTNWWWLYLRRPANPFDRRPYADREMVVVDSIRFPSLLNSTPGTPGTPKDTAPAPAGSAPLFSIERIQPYRGGHGLANIATTPLTTNPSPVTAWGYSEQIVPSATAAYAFFGNSVQYIAQINHTLGKKNSVNEDWDYVPFHDRDFMSPAELMLVPSCPPGLFTKQFVEENLNPASPQSASIGIADGPMTTAPAAPNSAGTKFVVTTPPTPHVYPYLTDKFFYTGASVAPAQGTVLYPSAIGNWTGDGWHKMLEFVEVPSSAFGAIGSVGDGQNFDWLRQDRKPGLININLIIDEEVFFGVVDDQRLNTNLLSTTVSSLPQVVTQIGQTGYPTHTYAMTNRGYTFVNPASGTEVTGMKAAFSDFLKLRAGGSGFLYAWGSGIVGSGGFGAPTGAGAVAQERPFRSLSYPDINFTIMRPATLPPSTLTTPVVSFAPPYVYADAVGNLPTIPGAAFSGDPGVRNPYLGLIGINALPPSGNPRVLPVIPPRRLFEIPDAANATLPPSGAAEFSGVLVNLVNQPIVHPQLSNNSATNSSNSIQSANLFLDVQTVPVPGAGIPTNVNQYLGANLTSLSTTPADLRQHPYYRSEMMQKVMNLTTVRTHQFAVWITVGFFEVNKVGSPALGVPDILGGELGLFAGKNVRYRSFFLLDRTRAVGFNPSSPQDFRDIVTYRRRIE